MTIIDLFAGAILTAVAIGAFGMAACLVGVALNLFRDFFGGFQ